METLLDMHELRSEPRKCEIYWIIKYKGKNWSSNFKKSQCQKSQVLINLQTNYKITLENI